MEITRGKMSSAERVVIYGPEGIGKSTLASRFPDPLFIDTEGSTSELDVARLPAPKTWNELGDEVIYVASHPKICKTLVIDTADWAERLCIAYICEKYNKPSIEAWNYGKGYVVLKEEFSKLIKILTSINEKGIHVVMTAHAMMRKFERPDESGAYDRWELKLEKKTAPLVKEWSTMLLFANYDIKVVKDENDRAKAHGGERVMYTAHHPCWDAKNRKGMPEVMPFKWESLEPYIDDMSGEKPEIVPEVKEEPKTPPEVEKPAESEPNMVEIPGVEDLKEQDALIDKLHELAGAITDAQIQDAVASKGYYPASVPIESYDPEFIKGVLIDAWPQVEEIIYNKIEQDVPF